MLCWSEATRASIHLYRFVTKVMIHPNYWVDMAKRFNCPTILHSPNLPLSFHAISVVDFHEWTWILHTQRWGSLPLWHWADECKWISSTPFGGKDSGHKKTDTCPNYSGKPVQCSQALLTTLDRCICLVRTHICTHTHTHTNLELDCIASSGARQRERGMAWHLIS